MARISLSFTTTNVRASGGNCSPGKSAASEPVPSALTVNSQLCELAEVWFPPALRVTARTQRLLSANVATPMMTIGRAAVVSVAMMVLSAANAQRPSMLRLEKTRCAWASDARLAPATRRPSNSLFRPVPATFRTLGKLSYLDMTPSFRSRTRSRLSMCVSSVQMGLQFRIQDKALTYRRRRGATGWTHGCSGVEVDRGMSLPTGKGLTRVRSWGLVRKAIGVERFGMAEGRAGRVIAAHVIGGLLLHDDRCRGSSSYGQPIRSAQRECRTGEGSCQHFWGRCATGHPTWGSRSEQQEMYGKA